MEIIKFKTHSRALSLVMIIIALVVCMAICISNWNDKKIFYSSLVGLICITICTFFIYFKVYSVFLYDDYFETEGKDGRVKYKWNEID